MLAEQRPSTRTRTYPLFDDTAGMEEGSDEEFTPEELSLVQDLLTPERFLKVWAALHEPVDDTLSKRQNSDSGLANTGWYNILKQHHAACFPRSASPEQLGECALQSSSSTSSVSSVLSGQSADVAAAAGPVTKRRLFPSESSPVRQKVLPVASTATSAARFSQRLTQAVVSPHQHALYDSDEEDTAKPPASTTPRVAVKPATQRPGTDAASHASPTVATAESVLLRLHSSNSSLQAQANASVDPTAYALTAAVVASELAADGTSQHAQHTQHAELLPSQHSQRAEHVLPQHAAAPRPAAMLSMGQGVADPAGTYYQHQHAASQQQRVFPDGRLSLRQTSPLQTAAFQSANANWASQHGRMTDEQQPQHSMLESVQQWDALRTPRGMSQDSLQDASLPFSSQPLRGDRPVLHNNLHRHRQHSLLTLNTDDSPPGVHPGIVASPLVAMPSGGNLSTASHGAHGRAASGSGKRWSHGSHGRAAVAAVASRTAAKGARKLLDSYAADVAAADRISTRLRSAKGQRSHDTDSDNSSSSDTESPSLPRRRLSQLQRPVQLPQKLPEQSSLQQSRYMTKHQSKQADRLQAAEQDMLSETPSRQSQGAVIASSMDSEADSPVCSAVSAVANRLQAVQQGLANAEHQLAMLSGTRNRASDRHSTAHGLQQDCAAGNAGGALLSSRLQPQLDATKVEQVLSLSEQRLVRRQLGFSPLVESERSFSTDSLRGNDWEADAQDQPVTGRLSYRLSTVAQTRHKDASGEALQGEDAEGGKSQKQPSVAFEGQMLSSMACSPDMQHQSDSVVQPLQGSTSALSRFVEQQSQEQLQQLLQQQLLRQLQQQWRQQPQQDTGIQKGAWHEDEEHNLTGAEHNLNVEKHNLENVQEVGDVDEATLASQQSVADCIRSADELVQLADIPVQSADMSTVSAEAVAQSAGKSVRSADDTPHTAAQSARQRMQAALQAVYEAERAVDAAVLFRPRIN